MTSKRVSLLAVKELIKLPLYPSSSNEFYVPKDIHDKESMTFGCRTLTPVQLCLSYFHIDMILVFVVMICTVSHQK